MMAGVREVLGFKADRASSHIRMATLSPLLVLQEISGIQLDTGSVRGHLHADTTLLGNEFSAQRVCSLILQYIIVIVAAGQLQWLVVRVNPLANGMFCTERFGSRL